MALQEIQPAQARELRPFLAKLIKYLPDEIMVRMVYVIGKQRMGKTKMVKSMVADIQQFHKDKVFFMITNDINDIFSNVDKTKPINIFLIDDAGRMQCSRKGMKTEQVEKIIDMKEVAHIAEDERGFKKGVILIFYTVQTNTIVDFQLRSEAEYTMIKFLNLGIKENRELIQGYKTEITTREIEQWIDALCNREKDALSQALLLKPTRKMTWYKFRPNDENCIIDRELKHKTDKDNAETVRRIEHEKMAIPVKALGADGQADLDMVMKEIIDAMRKEDEWSRRKKIDCYALSREGLTENQIGMQLYGEPKQQLVNTYKKQAGGEAKRRLGAIYENVVTARLAQEGYTVEHLGGIGEPDIIAKKGEETKIVSCKIYEDPRKAVSIEAKQFRPEINYAQKNNIEKFVLFFYNLAWRSEVVKEMDRDIETTLIKQAATVK
jgi:hypothetical protein